MPRSIAPPSLLPTPTHPHQGRDDAPAGVRPDADAIEFEVELIDFTREGHWQNLEWGERWALLERLKGVGNALYKGGKYKYAANRCVRAGVGVVC